MKKISAILLLFICTRAFAQDYEIEVYNSEIFKNIFMAELHSNYTFGGTTEKENGVLPTHKSFHETVELIYGITDCWEVSCYFFNALGSENRSSYVGSHLRTKIVAPEKWHLPVGIGISSEVGFMDLRYSEDDWGVEIRPIVDKKFPTLMDLYLSFNPVLEKSLHGLNKEEGYIFVPNVKMSFTPIKKFEFGLEYYGDMGPLKNLVPAKDGQHLLFFATDIGYWEKWEINAGYGIGLTPSSVNGIAKLIVGYKINCKKGGNSSHKE